MLTDNGSTDTVEFYLWTTNATLVYQKVASASVTNGASASVGTIVGAEATATGYSSGNALKAFKAHSSYEASIAAVRPLRELRMAADVVAKRERQSS